MAFPKFQIEEITYHQTLDLRARVLRSGQPPAEYVNPGDLRAGSFHLGAFHGRELVGTASFEIESHPSIPGDGEIYRLRGMATEPSVRRQGAGRALVQAGEKLILQRQLNAGAPPAGLGNLLWFNARVVAFPFYESLGFKYWGEVFEVPRTGPHKVMYKYLRQPIN